MLAVSGLGWGAVMAGKAARFEDLSNDQRQKTQAALEAFRRIVSQPEFNDPGERGVPRNARERHGRRHRGEDRR